jgi:uncharacterized membrane protein
MEATLLIAGLWLVFGGLHLGLATRRVRAALVGCLGEVGFAALYSALAAVSFALAVHAFAAHRLDGPPGPDLAAVPFVRATLIGVAVVGVVLMVASFARYADSPYAVGTHGAPDPQVHGLEAVTRHGFFVGAVLFAGAHALLAPHLVGAVSFLVLALVAGVGVWHQDRKLVALRGERHARYLAATSALPFAAIARGRQRLVARELPWLHLAAGVAVAAGLRHVHDRLFAAGGAWIVAVVVGGAAFAGLDAALRARRRRHRGGLPHAAGAR